MRLSIIGNVLVTIALVSVLLVTGVQGDTNTTSLALMPVAMSAGAVAPNGSSAEQTITSLHSLASSNSFLASSSNIPGIAWQDLLGGSYGESLSSVQQTPDGGYIACGGEGSLGGDGNVVSSHGYVDAWVVKFDPAGNIQWQRSYGGNHYDQGMSIQLTSDGGYIFAGLTNSSNSGDVGQNHGGSDAWVVKLNSSGNLQWQTVLGGSKDDEAYSIRQTSDGGYIFAGITGATITGDVNLLDHPFSGGHAWVVKLDSTGKVTWQKTYGGNNDDIASTIVQTSDGGYIFDGTTYSDNSGDVGNNHGLTDIWVVKLDSAGTIQWTKLLGGNNWDFTSPWFDDSIQQTTDGGYVVVGTTSSNFNGDVGFNHGSGDAWIIKLDNTGNITWQYPFGGSNMDWGTSIRQTPDNGYIFTGTTDSSNSGDVGPSYGNGDYWVGKLDAEGTLQWQQPLGGSGIEQAESILPTSDGGYIVTGRSYSSNSGVVAETNHGMNDAWIVNLTPRFVISVKDSDTGAFIPGANVGLYDPQNNTWMNQTSQDGPVAFNGSVGSNSFHFTDGSVFGLSVSADSYPSVSENVKFQITNQTVNVILTSFNRPTIEKTFSITQVGNPGWPTQDLTNQVDSSANAIEFHLLKDGWTEVFRDKETDVTKEDFGIDGGGLDNSTIHFHFGHGETDGNGNTFIDLNWYQNLHANDVKGKWGNKNKWVFLDSCDILNDESWKNAMAGTHGIFGFSTEQASGYTLIDQFYAYLRPPNNSTLTQAFLNASKDEVHGGAIAKVIFKNEYQYENDHLPGYGIVAPDDYSNNTHWFIKTQICN